jgi:hypothetical protein
MSEWKIAGCVREDGEWHHLPTRTGAKGFVSTWDISKEILDIAERALELLEEEDTTKDRRMWRAKRHDLLAECAGGSERCSKCGTYPAPQPTIADRPCLCKPNQPTVANQMVPCDKWASLIILADEIDKLKGQLEKDDL